MTDGSALAICERKFAGNAIGRVEEDGTFSGWPERISPPDPPRST